MGRPKEFGLPEKSPRHWLLGRVAEPFSDGSMNLLGSIKTSLYRRPKDELRRLFAWGPRGYFFEKKWKAEMEEAAKRLPPLLLRSNAKCGIFIFFAVASIGIRRLSARGVTSGIPATGSAPW